MSASFTWTGLEEQYRDLRSLALDLATNADELGDATAMNAANTIAGGYPYRSGNLKNHVVTEALRKRTTYQAGAVVLSKAPHSHLYERGTRKRKTNSGANRGRMPRNRVFVPAMKRFRKAFMADIKYMLPRWGLEARGGA